MCLNDDKQKGCLQKIFTFEDNPIERFRIQKEFSFKNVEKQSSLDNVKRQTEVSVTSDCSLNSVQQALLKGVSTISFLRE